MRFPLPQKDSAGKYKNGTMKRLAELTEYDKLNQPGDPEPLKEKLIPFYYVARDPRCPAFNYFNDVHYPVGGGNEPTGFKAKAMGVSNAYIEAGAGAIHEDVVNPFIRMLIDDIKEDKKDGWSVLKENDVYSIRGYMASKYIPSYSLNLPPQHLSSEVINWCNLLEGSSGGYDRALTEQVFDSISFAKDIGDWGDVDWKCFKGGSETLPKKIYEYLQMKSQSFVQYNKRVTAVEQVYTPYSIPSNYSGKEIPSSARRTISDSGVVEINIDGDNSPTKLPIQYRRLKVTVDGSETKLYDHVISTLPLTVLRTVDLRGAGLNVLQRNALRGLDYGPSTKIAVRFKSNWWFTKLGIFGGQSFTDLPIRTIVYPSYGTDDNPSKVLIASYSWTTDASRLGALALKPEMLKDLVPRNLAEAHHGVNGNTEITYDFLKNDLAEGENFHVKDWNTDEYTMGAYANFSPGEFEKLYMSLNHPAAGGCLHFAGEALSTRHGWVVGALDSAWKAVYEYLKITGQNEKLNKFLELWGANVEWYTPSKVLENGPAHDLLDEHVALVQKGVV